MFHHGFLLADKKVLILLEPAYGYLGLDPENGKVLWDWLKVREFPVVKDDVLFMKVKSVNVAYDPRTAKPVSDVPGLETQPEKKGWFAHLMGGCGPFNLSANFICGQFGPDYDFSTQTRLGDYLVKKSPCVSTTRVSEGLFLRPSFQCACDYTTHGTIIESSLGELPITAEAVESERLIRSADWQKVKPIPGGGNGWPMQRSNAKRNGSTMIAVGPNAALTWTVKPVQQWEPPVPMTINIDPDYEPVPPVSVGNLVVTADAFGVVRGLDLKSGKELWRYATGGRIYASPSIAHDRVYVPSGDGKVYCLEAVSGRELWRFDAAPLDRWLLSYGDVVSTWAICTGVLVHDGVAYVSAGLLNNNGAQLYALDAESGALRWHNRKAGLVDETSRIGVNPAGMLTIANGKLWLRSNSFDLKTGELVKELKDNKERYRDPYNGHLGRYTGVIGDRFLIWGGRRQFSAQSEQYIFTKAAIKIADLNDPKLNRQRSPHIIKAYQFPVWDNAQVFAVPLQGRGAHTHLLAWKTGDVTSYVEALVKDPKKKQSKKGKGLPADPPSEWQAQTGTWLAAALAPNGILVAHGDQTPKKGKPTDAKYKLSALDRKTGKPVWETNLPSEPLFDGIAIAADGSILVQMLDGTLCAVGTK